MRYHIVTKFLAVLLCACSLLVGIGGVAAVFVIAGEGLYSYTVDELREQRLYSDLNLRAEDLALRYAMENRSNCPESFIEAYAQNHYLDQLLTDGQWFYTLEDGSGTVLQSTFTAVTGNVQRYEFVIAPDYPVILSPYIPTDPTEVEVTQPEGLFPPATTEAEENPLIFRWRDEQGEHAYQIELQTAPAYLVTLYLMDGAYVAEEGPQWLVLSMGHEHRFGLLAATVISLLLFAITMVYLCSTAGKAPNTDELRPRGLNALALDVYALVTAAGVTASVIAIIRLYDWAVYDGYFLPGVYMMTLCGFAGSLLVVGFCFALAAQSKMPRGYRWKRCLLRPLCRLARLIWRWCRRIWLRFLALLPLTWQWLLTAAILAALLITGLALNSVALTVVALVLGLAVVLYGVFAFGTLMESARLMGQGDLERKVPPKWLAGAFLDFAGHLNALADVAVVAAKKQMSSERMKAELVTNVSHDIKTPLTSIINYVDLLQSAGTPEEREQCLEVLSRQSLRMKKLIDDLVEMSKASTGNITAELIPMDAAETVNQALGEFADKLDSRELIPVFRAPEESITMLADGRLTWRVLSNLLSNAVKYALPGTRLYVDLAHAGDNVLISLKNISREPLNVSTEELTERFVRGDISRNTEGSGLGLNIAKTLMELQHGQLQLLVDGDLFKVTLLFPEAKEDRS